MQRTNQGIDLEKKDRCGNTPLHLASQSGHLQVVKNLLVLGTFVNLKNHNGETPLHLAAERGHKEVVKVLLDSGADPALQDNNGTTPSHLAAAEGFLEIMELLSKRFDIKERIKQLHEAAENGSINQLKLLLQQQLPLDEKNERGETPLYVATARGHRECAEMLLEAGADVSVVTDEGSTVLHAAAMSGLACIIEKLCISNKSSNRKSNNTEKDDDPITDEDKREETEWSSKQIPSIEWQDIYKKCENMVLSDSDTDDEEENKFQIPVIEEYVKDLFSPNATVDQLEKNRLYLQEILGNLCPRIDVDSNLGGGATLLHLAAVCQMDHTVRILLKRKADVNARTKDRVTPLMMACAGGSLEVVRTLVEAGSDPKLVDNKMWSALFYAVRVRSLHTTRYLLTLGLDPNAKDIKDNTPLHIASIFNAGADIITALCDAGGDLHARNIDFLYPFSLAQDASTFNLLQPRNFNFNGLMNHFMI